MTGANAVIVERCDIVSITAIKHALPHELALGRTPAKSAKTA
jgi:hypothetical protein